jgi:hypothetical protein
LPGAADVAQHDVAGVAFELVGAEHGQLSLLKTESARIIRESAGFAMSRRYLNWSRQSLAML